MFKTIFCMFIGLMIYSVAWGDTCVETTFNVKYSCNGGTPADTLPVDTTAQYGSAFTPSLITRTMCAPPSGYMYAGQAVIVDGKTVAYSSRTAGAATSFTYYFTTDIEIGPRWVPMAKPEVLASHVHNKGIYKESNGDVWTVGFEYGWVSGVAKCTNIKTENIAIFVGTVGDYDAVEEAGAGGQYCYCRMTEPYIDASPWVFVAYFASDSACSRDCISRCLYAYEDFSLSKSLRASLFMGAMHN